MTLLFRPVLTILVVVVLAATLFPSIVGRSFMLMRAAIVLVLVYRVMDVVRRVLVKLLVGAENDDRDFDRA